MTVSVCGHCGAPRKGGDATCEFCGIAFANKLDAPIRRPEDDPAVLAALRSGNKIEAIRLYRLAKKCGLLDAKNAVEDLERRLG